MDGVSRRYGAACLTCRRRKVRCDGAKPKCNKCVKLNETCVYKATDAFNNELICELRQKDQELERLRKANRQLTQSAGTGATAGLSDVSASFDRPSCGPQAAEVDEFDVQDPALTSERSIDENGAVNFYGATSRFHTSPYMETLHEADATEEHYHRKWLKSNARFQSTWEAKSYERLAIEPAAADLSPDSAKTLLQIYWTWQAPLHNCVYRRCFFRDFALGGPYFSPFLLTVLFSHACRHTRADDPLFAKFGKGEYFLHKAKRMLPDELETPRVPTIQALLILGGRQCAVGKTSEGWLYTSMAFSMIRDLGLHLPKSVNTLMKELEPDDLEARKRLYLSAYTWDKSISLTLGRPPQLREMPFAKHCLLDDADDLEEWRPVYLCDTEQAYPPTHSLSTSTFSAFGELAVLVDQIYAMVYGVPGTRRIDVAKLHDLERQLRTFYDALPAHLRFTDTSITLCPPPHILSLNILYHTLLILLYRPFDCFPNVASFPTQLMRHAHEVCSEQAALVNVYFQAHGRTFK
ncbi:hypothetical protein LTR17_007925 [Elasticomyces elasticus]|nr:hypothetical protein LTR17_007925 [Elasticomyces elasticus]